MEDKKYDILETANGPYKTTLTRKFRERKPWIPDDPKQVKSHIPGTVVEILVKEGQKVREGDMLIIYKAMKMNNNILSKFDGTIETIFVKEGDNLPNHSLLLEYE